MTTNTSSVAYCASLKCNLVSYWNLSVNRDFWGQWIVQSTGESGCHVTSLFFCPLGIFNFLIRMLRTRKLYMALEKGHAFVVRNTFQWRLLCIRFQEKHYKWQLAVNKNDLVTRTERKAASRLSHNAFSRTRLWTVAIEVNFKASPIAVAILHLVFVVSDPNLPEMWVINSIALCAI